MQIITASPPGSSWWTRRFGGRMVFELAFCAFAFVGYQVVRYFGRAQIADAYENARAVVRFEKVTGLFVEPDLQSLVLGNDYVVWFLNRYYVGMHFPTAVGLLVFMYVCRVDLYGHVRRTMFFTTVAGLVIHLMYPLAPPRMFWPFVDTLAESGPTVYSDDAVASTVNQFAAMPSLHFGWASIFAYAMIISFRSRWRFVALVHPLLTLLAIVLTANHYIIDAIAAGLLVAVAMVIDRAVRAWWRSRRSTPAGVALNA